MKHFIILFLFIISSCNKIVTERTLNKTDVEFISKIGLLASNENIIKFYSEFNNYHAGNFFTNKRIATYWFDERDSKKNKIEFSYYQDIKQLDTIYNAGFTYCPYIEVTKNNGDSFKVSVNGERKDVKMFFEQAFYEWKNSK